MLLKNFSLVTPRALIKMKNDAGEIVDLYIPRKWCVRMGAMGAHGCCCAGPLAPGCWRAGPRGCGEAHHRARGAARAAQRAAIIAISGAAALGTGRRADRACGPELRRAGRAAGPRDAGLPSPRHPRAAALTAAAPRPRSSWTNNLIGAKDHRSVQINVGHLDEAGVFNGSYSTFALCGRVRAKGEADSAADRLWATKRTEIGQ